MAEEFKKFSELGVYEGDVSDAMFPIVIGGENKITAGSNISAASKGALFPRSFGAVADGVTDDSAAIQSTIEAAEGNNWIDLEGATYKVSSPIFLKSNLLINGNNALLVSGLPVIAAPTTNGTTIFASTMFVNAVTPRSVSATVSANIDDGDNVITLSNTTNVQVGDLVLITTTKPVISTTKNGLYKKIIAKTSTTLTLEDAADDSLDTATDSLAVSVYAPLENVTLQNIRISLIANSRQSGIQLVHTKNTRIENVTVIGSGEAYVGIGISGFDGKIVGCYAEEFHDSVQNSFGYGLLVSGHNMHVLQSDAYRAKHGIAAGDSRFTNTHINIIGNFLSDPITSAADAHSSCRYVKMTENVVVNTTGTGAGLWARGRNFDISDNEIYGCPVGIKIIEAANTNQRICDNKIFGATYGIYGQLDAAAGGDNFNISGNEIHAHTGIAMEYDFLITNYKSRENMLDCEGHGMTLSEMENVDISLNTIMYAKSEYGAGIIFNPLTTPVNGKLSNANLNGNIIKRIGAIGTSCIRFTGINPENYHLIGNTLSNSFGATITYDGGVSATGSNTIRDNIGWDYVTTLPTADINSVGRRILLTNGSVDRYYVGVLSASATYAWRQDDLVKQSAAPTTGTWYVNDVVWNSAPSAGGTMLWICTVGGTPGTWISIVPGSQWSGANTAGTYITTVANIEADAGNGTNSLKLRDGVISKTAGSGFDFNTGIKVPTKSSFGSAAISNSALVEFNATNQGILPPRMTAAQRALIASPVVGLEIYCTDVAATDGSTGVKQVYNGTTWKNCW